MHHRRAAAFSTVFVVTVMIAGVPSVAQEDTRRTPLASPKLQNVFDDDFTRDTRDKYGVHGDVSWSSGHLTLGRKMHIEREINGGARAVVNLQVERLNLDPQDPQTELRIWVWLVNGSSCFIRLRTLSHEGNLRDEVALANTMQADGKLIAKVVRKLIVDHQPKANFRVEFRHGLVLVHRDRKLVFRGFVPSQIVAVRGCLIEGVVGDFRISHFSAEATAAPPARSNDQQLKYAQIAPTVRQLDALWVGGDLPKAIEKAKELLKLDEDVFGREHPEYANGLANLAEIELRNGQLPAAQRAFEECLSVRRATYGNQHPDCATTLDRLGVVLLNTGEINQAQVVLAEAIKIREGVLGTAHDDYASSVANLGLLHAHREQFEKAIPLFEQAKKAYEQQPNADKNSNLAVALHNLASMYVEQGEYEKAKRNYDRAVDIWSHADNSRDALAQGLSQLVVVYAGLHEYQLAEKMGKRALEIQEEIYDEPHHAYGTTLHNLARLYGESGDYKQAEERYKQALAVREAALGSGHVAYMHSLNSLATLYIKLGDYARSEQLFQRVFEIHKANPRRDLSSTRATALTNLAMLYLRMGDYVSSEPLLQEALALWAKERGEHSPEYASSLNNLAVLYEEMGRYDAARECIEKSNAIFLESRTRNSPEYAMGLNNLGQLDVAKGDYDSAKTLLLESLTIAKRLFGEKHPEVASLRNNVAISHVRLQNYSAADALYDQSIKIEEDVLGPLHPGLALTLNNLVELRILQGKNEQARQLADRAANIIRRTLDSASLVQSERQQTRGQWTQRFYLDRCIAIAVDANAAAENTAEAQARRADTLEQVWKWKGAVTTRQSAYRRLAADAELSPLFADLQSVSRSLSAISSQAPIPPASSASASRQDAYAKKREAWSERFSSLNRQREDLEKQIATRSESFRIVQSPVTLTMVQQALPKDAALVDFLEYQHGVVDPKSKHGLHFERHFVAFVVRKSGPVEIVPLGHAPPIAEAVAAFRLPFSNERSDKTARASVQAGELLRRLVWAPVEKHLGSAKMVILSPDTDLGSLPFAALPGHDAGTYLLEQYRLQQLPMVQLMPRLIDRDARPTRNDGLLIVGNIDYDHRVVSPETPDAAQSQPLEPAEKKSNTWESLAGFTAEVTPVKSTYSRRFGSRAPVEFLAGKNATSDAFLEKASDYRTLHLITHGYFADSGVRTMGGSPVKGGLRNVRAVKPDPLFNTWMPGLLSGLVMAGANLPVDRDHPNDGICRASEIEAGSLAGVDLVFLSACETARGAVAGGEGITGLQRAFHVAGARSVVASLWKVEDTSTRLLVERFYKNLWERNMTKTEALHDAQIWLLKNPEVLEKLDVRFVRGPVRKLAAGAVKPVNPKGGNGRTSPFFWAAFQLSGDWE